MTGWSLRSRAESLTGSTCTCCTAPREGYQYACSQGSNAVGTRLSERLLKCTWPAKGTGLSAGGPLACSTAASSKVALIWQRPVAAAAGRRAPGQHSCQHLWRHPRPLLPIKPGQAGHPWASLSSCASREVCQASSHTQLAPTACQRSTGPAAWQSAQAVAPPPSHAAIHVPEPRQRCIAHKAALHTRARCTALRCGCGSRWSLPAGL